MGQGWVGGEGVIVVVGIIAVSRLIRGLSLQRFGMRPLEAIVAVLVGIMGITIIIESGLCESNLPDAICLHLLFGPYSSTALPCTTIRVYSKCIY